MDTSENILNQDFEIMIANFSSNFQIEPDFYQINFDYDNDYDVPDQ